MERFTVIFESLTSLQKLTWVIVCLGFFWILEGVYPMFKYKYNKWKHAKTNLTLLLFTMIINIVFGLITVGIFHWINQAEFGLLHLVEFTPWIEVLIGVLLLDLFAQYFVHYLLHKVSFMWRFHMVHHSDTEVDVTTGTRHHPGDFAMREIFSLIAIVIGGLPISIYLFYRILTVFCTYFTHANFNIPSSVDRVLSWVIISPNTHKFHHHHERPWTDKNYGNIFSIWDRIFGTFVYGDPKDIVYGLDVLDQTESTDLKRQLEIPFDKSIITDY